MQKDTAGQRWIVFAFQDEGGANPGEPVTGDAANITANLRIDGGAANAVDDTNPAELEDGYYFFTITQTESNGDLILMAPQSATANVNVIGVPGAVWTTPGSFNAGVVQTGDSYAAIGTDGTGLTEAGGTGAHLTAINLPNQTMDIVGDITGNLSGSVGSVTGAVGSVTGSVGSVTGAVGSVTGTVGGIAGTITTLDALDTAQDTQHTTTQGKVDTAQADLDIITGADGVNLLSATQTSIDTIETDTTTDIPALIATAQADLDIITGADGVNLLSATQATIDAIPTAAENVNEWETQSQAAAGGFHVNVMQWKSGTVQSPAVSGVPKIDVVYVSGSSTAADRLEGMMDGMRICQVNDASATLTDFAADGFTETDDDHFNGRLITFMNGNLAAQQTDIIDYDAAGGAQGSQQFTVTALTEAPEDGDFFVIH